MVFVFFLDVIYYFLSERAQHGQLTVLLDGLWLPFLSICA